METLYFAYFSYNLKVIAGVQITWITLYIISCSINGENLTSAVISTRLPIRRLDRPGITDSLSHAEGRFFFGHAYLAFRFSFAIRWLRFNLKQRSRFRCFTFFLWIRGRVEFELIRVAYRNAWIYFPCLVNDWFVFSPRCENSKLRSRGGKKK